jgi:hypothetical protein
MKKYSWIVALLLALSLAFIACPEPKDKDPAPGPGDKPTVISKGAFSLVLDDNFQYGEGYQGLIDDLKLFPGGKITEGDVYSMKITFTVSRGLEDVITVGLVDRTPPDGGGDYWIPLSYDADDGGWELEDDDAPAVAATVEEAADGATVTKVITFTALHSALTGLANANCIAFETQGQGTPGTASSGIKGPVTLKFTEFLFVKGTAEDLEGGPTEPPEPGYEPNPVVDGEDYTVKLEGLQVRNEEPATAAYANLFYDIREAFPDNFDIMKYDKFTVLAKFFDAEGTEIELANGLGQFIFASAGSYGNWISTTYANLGTAATTERTIRADYLTEAPKYLYIQNGTADVKFIEITEITFHWGTDREPYTPPPPPAAEVGITGFTKVAALTLDKTSKKDSTIWAWEENGDSDYLKGRLAVAKSTEITTAMVAGSKIQIYWVSGTGTALSASVGIGSFGTIQYNTGTGGVSGIAVLDVTATNFVTETGNAGQLNLNTYNDGLVARVIFYTAD